MTIIGFGTGRCGTQSLARLLNYQEHFSCTHEISPELPYPPDKQMAEERAKYFADNDNVGDIALYNLYYISWFKDIPNTRFVWLERPREEVVESFMQRTPTRNHWQEHNGTFWKKDEWDSRFPNFGTVDLNSDPYEQKREAIRSYWEGYNEDARLWSNKVPTFHLQTENLSDEQTIKELLDFVGIPEQDRIIKAVQSNAIQEWD